MRSASRMVYFCPMIIPRRWLLAGMLLIAVFGAADAGYLASFALAGKPLVCNFLDGCQIVATSPYSRIFGVPLALFGFFFYITAFGLLARAFTHHSRLLSRLLIAVTFLGFLASLYFMYLQAFIIRSWCEYCILSAISSTLLFILTLFFIATYPRPSIPEIREEKRLEKTTEHDTGTKSPS